MKKKLIVFFVKLTFVALLLFGGFLGFIYLGVFGHVFSEKELKEFKNETASLVVSDQGRLIGKFFADNRTNVDFEQLPNDLINALVATEDARYFEHEGVRIEKHVSYYVGYMEDTDFTIQPEEVAQAQWCTLEEARVLLTYDLSKELLDEVVQYLENK